MIGSAIAELLQAVHGQCVYPGKAPAAKYPVIIFAMSRHEGGLPIDSASSATTLRTGYDIDVLAKTYTQAEQIAQSLFSAYHGWSGYVAGVQISMIDLQAESVVYEDAEGVWVFPFSMTVYH